MKFPTENLRNPILDVIKAGAELVIDGRMARVIGPAPTLGKLLIVMCPGTQAAIHKELWPGELRGALLISEGTVL